MKHTLGQAAKRLEMSKSTLSRHRREGRFSAEKDKNGAYIIEDSELARAYPDQYSRNVAKQSQSNSMGQEKTGSWDNNPSSEVQRWKERAELLENERDDLRRRLDDESEERRKLTAMLTDQREKTGKSFWARLLGRSTSPTKR